MAAPNEETKSERLYLLWIGTKVEQDYERRGVFPDLRSMPSSYSAQHGRHLKVSRAMLRAVAEDAIEQRAIKRGREGKSLATSYGLMSKNLLRGLGMDHIAIAHAQMPIDQSDLAPPEYQAGTGRQPVAWSDCLWRPTP